MILHIRFFIIGIGNHSSIYNFYSNTLLFDSADKLFDDSLIKYLVIVIIFAILNSKPKL